MMCCFLLLLTLTSCVCEPTFVVKVTQSSYQAEENHNITLEWTFTTATTQGSSSYPIIYCELMTDDPKEHKVLYHLRQGVEFSKDKDFSGRVQCDRDVLREGRVRLHVSRLRVEDSGLYRCWVNTKGFNECHLNVSAAADQPETWRPRPENWGRIGLYIGLPLAAAVVVVLAMVTVQLIKPCRSSCHKSSDGKKNVQTVV